MERKFKYNRFGLTENPVGKYVSLPWRGVILLYVRHFNGEDWPIEPAASAVTILE